MNIFVDISGIFALLVRDDYMHVRAKENFAHFARNRFSLITSSFVLVETIALLQRRISMAAVHDFYVKNTPLD